MPGPFDAVRVIEISEGVGGPMAAMLLADLGADVLKVEPPRGDRLRGAPAFHVLNRSKAGVSLDLANVAERERLRPLLAAADVVIVGGAVQRHADRGLDTATLEALNERLIIVHVPAYGSRGPLRATPENETLLAAMSGILQQQWGYQDRPTALTIPLVGYAQGIMTANAIAAALLAREATGRGQVVECSGLGAAYAFQSGSFVFGDGVSAMAAMGDPKGPSPAYQLYETADGKWFFLACLTPAFWTKLLVTLERYDLLADPELQDGPLTMTDSALRARVRAELQSIFHSQSRDHWMRVLADADVPRGPVQTRTEFMNEPQVQHVRMVAALEDDQLGRTRQMGIPITFTATPGAIRGPAPALDSRADLPRWTPQPPAAKTKQRSSPLDGVVVLDLAAFIAGSYASMVLADLGATVIKIEPHSGDPFRQFGYGFQGWNRGKRSLALDLKAPAGRSALLRLVERADVVLENFRVGVMDRLGLSYETLTATNPRLVMVSVSANGPDGPLSTLPGYDPIMQARSGAMASQGGDGNEPVYYQVALSDYASATMAAFAASAGLLARTRTGRGQHVHTSLLQNAMTVQAGEFIDFDGPSVERPGGPDLLGWSALDRAYRCAGDGWIYLAFTNDDAWQGLARELGHPEWLSRWDGATARRHPVDGPLAELISAAFASAERDATVTRLIAAGLPCAPCIRADEALTHPQATANDLGWHTQHPVWGRVEQTGAWARFDSTPMNLQGPSPEIGQHSHDILADFGLSSNEIASLIDDGVVTQWHAVNGPQNERR